MDLMMNDEICDLMAENGNMKRLLAEMLPDMESRVAGLQIVAHGPELLSVLQRNEQFVRDIKAFIKDFEVLDLKPAIQEQLKPCPFCGASAEWEYTPWDDKTQTGDDGTGWIECTGCHIKMDGYCREEAEERWNK